MRVADSQPPYAVIRRMLLGDPNKPEEWFRVVTWAPESKGRELIGWVRTFDAAAGLGWDHYCAYQSWRGHMAAKRMDAAQMSAQKPPAEELVNFWRQHQTAAVAPRSGS